MKKLKKILLINWLYFSKEVIEVGDVNFLTGKNGAGKSTVIDALQIVLLGETNARNFNLAANERSQRTLDGYLMPIWTRITRIPAEARTFRPILSVNLRTMWSTIVSCAA